MFKIGWCLSNIGFFICSLVVSSGVLSAKLSQAATYYVAKTGSNSNTCTQAQNESTPKLTIRGGVDCLTAGDKLYVKDGTYVGSTQLGWTPSGTSWAAPITIAAYPGHRPVIVPEPGLSALYFDKGQQYVVIDGFVIDGKGGQNGIYIAASSSHPTPRYIRIKNTEVKNAPSQGILARGTGYEFINLDVHDNGFPAPCRPNHIGQCHGLYLQGTGHLVDGGKYYNNEGFGLHLYPSISHSVVRNVEAYNNPATGILVKSGGNNEVYDNVVWGNRIVGIRILSTSNLIANNMVYDNSQYGILADIGGNTIEDNTAYDNGINIKGATNNTFDNNLCGASFGTLSPCL